MEEESVGVGECWERRGVLGEEGSVGRGGECWERRGMLGEEGSACFPQKIDVILYKELCMDYISI